MSTAKTVITFDRESLKSHLQKGKKRRKTKKQIGKEKSQRHAKKLSRNAKNLKHFALRQQEQVETIPDTIDIPTLDVEVDTPIVI